MCVWADAQVGMTKSAPDVGGSASDGQLCPTENGIIKAMRIEWSTAAAKHGISEESARYVIEHCGLYYKQPAPPQSPAGLNAPRRVYLGDDADGTALEVMAVAIEPDGLLVIHAMPLRQKYRRQYEGAKKWLI